MRLKRYLILILITGCLVQLVSCKKEFTPRPRGYFRITFPAKSYKPLGLPLPYNFDIPAYAVAGRDSTNLGQPSWITIEIPANHAQIHLSYKKVNGNLGTYIEESRTLAYKHTQKASSIDEQLFINQSKRVYGTVYNIHGNAASPMQFYLTDSVSHFLRGSLYIKEVPNIDSLQPVINFLNQDILRLVETTEWKNK